VRQLCKSARKKTRSGKEQYFKCQHKIRKITGVSWRVSLLTPQDGGICLIVGFPQLLLVQDGRRPRLHRVGRMRDRLDAAVVLRQGR
jgi:hypothetical protein